MGLVGESSAPATGCLVGPRPRQEDLPQEGRARFDLLVRAGRRVANHRGEALTVGVFMVLAVTVSDITGLAGLVARKLGSAGLASGLLAAFATVWLPIAVIDFRRCTRETALRHQVEADLEEQTTAARKLASQRRLLTAECEELLALGGPRIVYQPIVDVVTTLPVGYEALSRFDDGTAPDHWFAKAASVGLGTELELAAIRNALTALPQLPSETYLSINASPEALRDARLPHLIAAHDPRRTVVELTEHVPLGDYAELRRLVAELSEIGARLAIDDAGAGYASFRHIVDLQPHTIKIDRSLISGVHLEPGRRSLLIAFVSFAADLGASLVAEGVEDPRDEAVIRRWGLHFAQGWLYGRPEPLAYYLESGRTLLSAR